MYKQILSLAVAMLPLTSALPLETRAPSAADVSVAQLAIFLEHLEFNLYTGGYDNFTDAQYLAQGFPEGFRDNVGVIANQESIHAATLSNVLTSNGIDPVPTCAYSFPYTDPKTFAALSNMITTVGIGTYLGGAVPLMGSPTLLTAAASILTNEACHDSYLRAGLGASPFPNPFDTTLSALWAYNLALEFVVSCPEYLPLVQLPVLKLDSPVPAPNLMPPTPVGTTLDFTWDPSMYFVAVDPSAPLYIAIINQNTAPIYQQVRISASGAGSVPVPEGVAGVGFAVLTTFAGGQTAAQLSQYGTLAGPAVVALS